MIKVKLKYLVYSGTRNALMYENNCYLSLSSKEYEIEGRYNWRGPPYHMIIDALQRYTIYIRNIQNRLLYTR